MSGDANVIEILEQHRKENLVQFQRIEGVMTKLADAMTQQALSTTRMEERHERQDDALRRMGKQLDDHEIRIRSMEKVATTSQQTLSFGWKAVSTAAVVLLGVVSIVASLTSIGVFS